MSKNKRGTEDQLAALHGMLASHFKERLASGDKISPAELNVIRQFLRDNGIECIGEENTDIRDISASLPDFDELDNTPGRVSTAKGSGEYFLN